VRIVGNDNVLELKIAKPKSFTFTAGAYAFVKIPKISRFEWHPFTISSAPGDPYLRFHIKAVGDWTKAALAHFRELTKEQELRSNSDVAVDPSAKLPSGVESESLTTPWPEVRVFGPYGAPSQAWLHYDVVCFVATGVGVTPYLSILSDIVTKALQYRCKNCGSTSLLDLAFARHELPSKIFFIWASRDEAELRWADDVLRELAILDHEGFVTSEHYLTTAKGPQDIESEQGSNRGYGQLHSFVHFGRPDFSKIMASIRDSFLSEGGKYAHNAAGDTLRCGVFATCPKVVDKQLSKVTLEESREGFTFDYYAENF
jgi:dual oxidase